MKSRNAAHITNVTWVVAIRFILAFTLIVSLFPASPLIAKANEVPEEEIQTTEIADANVINEITLSEANEQGESFNASMSEDVGLNDSSMSLTAMSNKAKTTPLYAASNIATGNFRGVSWSISSNGVLTLGNGAEQTLDCTGYSPSSGRSPFYDYVSSITSIVVSGKVVAKGNLKYLFKTLTNVTSANLLGLDTSNATNMNGMFWGCTKLTALDLSSFNTSNVTDMSYMFYNCPKLKSVDVSSFNTSNVTDMSDMFCLCNLLASLDVSKFDTTNVKNMSGMFNGCYNLTSINVSSFNTSNATSMSAMFYNCRTLKSLNVKKFNTSNVTNMSNMFANCYKLTSLNISNFNTSNVKNMSNMFSGCSGLTSISVSNFVTTKVTDMSYMFAGCSGLTFIDASNFVTTNVTNMSSMFYGCSKLSSINTANFNTVNVTNMSGMFCNCKAMTTLDLSHFITTSLTNIDQMFNQCTSLSSINLNNFNTSNVTSMNSVFNNCISLTSIDLSSFDTSNVTYMNAMFGGCSSLTTIIVSPLFIVDSVTESQNMFYGDTLLVGGNGTSYSAEHIDVEYARIDATSAPGYFTDCTPIQPREVTATPGENATFMLSAPSYTLGTLEISLDGIEAVNIPNAYWSLDGENWFSATRSDGVYTLNATSGVNGNGGAALFTDYGTYEIHWKVDATDDGYSETTGTFNFTIDPYVVSPITPSDQTYTGAMLYITKAAADPTTVSTYAGYIFSGDYGAVMPGTYACVVAPAMGCTWEDGTNNAVTLTWTINETSGATINYWYVKDRVLHIEYGTFTSQTIGANDADEWPAETDNAGHPMCSSKFPTTMLNRADTYSNKNSIVAWDSCEIGTSLQESSIGIGSYAFYKCSNMQAISGLSNTHASGTSLTGMFYGCTNLTMVDLGDFSTAGVTNMASMFRDCTSLTTLDLNGFDTSKVTTMTYMFQNCSNLTSLNLESFDTSKVTTFSNIFTGTYNLREITLGSSFAPQGKNIANANNKLTLPGEYWYNMDMEPTVLTSVDDLLNNWDGSTMAGTWIRQSTATHELIDCSGTSYSNFRSRLSYISGGTNNTTTSNSYVKRVVFISGGHEYKGLDLSDASLFKDLGTREMYIDFSKAQDGSILARMADDGTVYIYSEGQIVSGSNCKGMFYYFFNLIDVDMSGIEFKGVTTVEQMFYNCNRLESISGISNLVGSSCTTTRRMFYDACHQSSNRTKDLYLDCGGWDTSNVTDMSEMFDHCSAIEDIDVSAWDVSNVESFSDMFAYASGLEHLDCSKWNTSSVKKMYMMFWGTSLEELNLSNFDTTHLIQNPNSGSFFPSTMKKVVLGPNWTFGFALSSDGTSYGGVFNPNTPSSEAPYSGTWEKVGEGIPYTPSEMAALKTPLNGYDYTGTWVWSGYEETQHGTYTVSFNANGGQGYVPDPIKATQGEYMAVPHSSLANPGYAFVGWNTQQDGNGAWAYEGGTFTDLASPGESATMYAQWREDRWTISVPLAVKYNSKNAGAVSETFGADITIAGSFPGTIGVSGSSTGLVCDQTGRIPITCSSLAEPLVFSNEGTQTDSVSLNGMAKLGRYKGTIDYVTAHDKSQDYNLAYVLSGGTLSGDEPMTYKDANDVVFVSPTRDGYTFAGWIWDGQATPVTSLPFGTIGDLQLVAVWTEA